MKKIYLHMGAHKTGSTSFQLTCYKNTDVLKAQNVAYPHFIPQRKMERLTPNHSRFFNLMFFNKVTDCKNANARSAYYLSQLKNYLTHAQNIILSAESISAFSEQNLMVLKEFLLGYQADIVPIIAIRSPYELHCSAMQQVIKVGEHRQYDNFRSQIKKIQKIKRCFPDAQFYPFRSMCKHEHGPVGFLLEKMEISCENIQFYRANESLPNAYIRLQNIINQKHEHLSGAAQRQTCRAIHINHGCFKAKFLLTEDEFTKIKNDCDRENKFFEEFLGKEFCDKQIKFSNSEETLHEIANYFQAYPMPDFVSPLRNALDECGNDVGDSDNFSKKFRFIAPFNNIIELLLKKRAFALVKAEKFAKAEKIAQGYVLNNPNIPWPYYILSKVQWSRGHVLAALENIQMANKLEPKNKVYEKFLKKFVKCSN